MFCWQLDLVTAPAVLALSQLGMLNGEHAATFVCGIFGLRMLGVPVVPWWALLASLAVALYLGRGA